MNARTIAIVGPCASGKTTLAEGLQVHGYDARQIAQEHSYVQDMWKQITDPDILIYLDASFETCTERKQLNWKQKEFDEQVRRLSHAREHCDLYLMTDQVSIEEILEVVLDHIESSEDSGSVVHYPRRKLSLSLQLFCRSRFSITPTTRCSASPIETSLWSRFWI